MLRFANPANFLRLANALLPWLAGLTALLFAVGLALALTGPDDYQQGRTVMIMYLHVPAAWNAMFIYMVMTASALGTLVWRHPVADAAQKAAAPLGAAFTFICLATGSLWGKPMWGTWWVWDARLTSVLILFLIYLGIVAIWQVFEDQGRAAKAAAIFTLTAVVIIPIIHFSVQWWNTLHQPASVFRMGGPTIATSMLVTLLTMALAFTCLFLTLHLMGIRNEILRRRLRRLTILEASGAEPVAVAAAAPPGYGALGDGVLARSSRS
jgi:heme exporter protein C